MHFTFCRATWVRVNGTKYQVPCAIVIGNNDELEFGRVVSIYVDDSIVFFEFIPLATHSFCHNFHVFALVSESECKYLIK